MVGFPDYAYFRKAFQPSNQERVVWPASLAKVTFGWSFRRSIDRVAWPSSLKEIKVSNYFNEHVMADLGNKREVVISNNVFVYTRESIV